jgi:uncharacterized membrane protein YeaQ/YmgE (transglycosylase-associated protein family)
MITWRRLDLFCAEHDSMLELLLDEYPPEKGTREMLYAFIFWVIVGAIAGALAKAIMPGDDPGGIIVTIIIGIVGAIVGGWLLSLIGLGGGAAAGAWIWSIISGIVGAVILLAIYRAVMARRT